jgi:hypothetical protein
MNSNAFFNRIEILLYSTLISAMSGINQLRARIQHSSTIPIQPSAENEAQISQLTDQIKISSRITIWDSIKDALLSLLLWIVLGFAAGFLIGMINPG